MEGKGVLAADGTNDKDRLGVADEKLDHSFAEILNGSN